MNIPHSISILARAALAAAALFGASALHAAEGAAKKGKGGKAKAGAGEAVMANDPFVGRWALSLSSGAAGWLEVKNENGWLDASLLWGGGSVLPVAGVNIGDGVLTLNVVREVERKDAAGKVVRKQQLVS